ncbi:hypothetical protein DVB69_00930 [Sporosarcina sp. BI001-red]|uniref:hypothetical protein n=1 Tax=Sporosarcina sp. BI001-red TaxID=2282866 RepID=UPI000E28609A|nr:hypothetical protein [Sporosarcina sp. BI001-red]REB11174.1 hypothetical protein DVB69_00930 [Sporosarcina sp. BI001-red]
MFFNKKEKPIQVLYNVELFTNKSTDDDTLQAWTDQLMDAAENVGTAEWIIAEEYNPRQLEILKERFPTVDQQQPFFQINEIDYTAIQEEVEKMESTQKWRKFFKLIPLGVYLDIEDRIVTDASRALLCTNDLDEAERFLVEHAKIDNLG